MNTNIMYASRKRRKPVQKAVKPTPPDGVKSNPSKRHRDRLNTELDRLASLLPFSQEIISKLDKLSVLRLSVSFLRAKGFFEVALKGSKTDGNGIGDNRRTIKPGEDLRSIEGELLLQALNGFVLVVASDGLVFFASSTIQDYLGFQQSDVIHQSVFELIHTEDRVEFQRQLHWALDPAQPSGDGQGSPSDNGFTMIPTLYNPEQLPPENSSFMERNFVCRLRCLLDNSSGFLAMNFQGRLKYLHGQNKKGKDGALIPPQLALFGLATPLQPPSILEIRTKNFIFRTKHRLDFTPTGCDAKGSMVLGYTESELCIRGTGYQFIHAADMLYCAENHVRMIKTGESGMTVFRLLTKNNGWAWVQANARLVYKNGRPDYIIATQRPLTEEEGAEHLRKRSSQLPFIFATGEAVLYESSFPFQGVMGPTQNKPKSSSSKNSSSKAATNEAPVNPASLLGAMLRQDESVYICHPAPNTFSFDNFYKDARNELSNGLPSGWQENRLPIANDNMKQGEAAFSQGKDATLSSDRAEVFLEGKNNELYNIMRSLGIDFEDLEMIQRDEEFFRNEFDYSDIGEIDVADEILNYVQDSLNGKSDCMFMNSNVQQIPCVQDSSNVVVQSRLNTTQMCPQQPNQMIPQQLCQKMKHMQVNGVLTNWNSVTGVPLTYRDQPASINNVVPDFYKSELTSAPFACKQEYMPYQETMPSVPLPSNVTQMDFDLGNVEQTVYSVPANLDGLMECLSQTPEMQDCGVNAQTVIINAQPCYSGAVSMYQCLQEPQPSCMNQMQYNAVMPAQQQLINKQLQNGFVGGNLNETYAAPLEMVNSTQAAPHLPSHHLPASSKLFPDLPSSGFM
ncbi:aryl hydrocarbon receptor [Pyxicephalus adspersus]|uniref:aryl hydrocarbon receptor n=1 Tax=Pyxicephalus adspersus TaxID=30357 RepID=UPI003B5B2379